MHHTYLETIGYVYKDDVYASSGELKCKLEPSFVAGLKCAPHTRQLFFQIFNANFASVDLYERLCYIIITQNWEAFGAHYWIKQCIQMTLGACAHADTRIEYSDAAVAARFRFDPLLHAADCVYGSETAPHAHPDVHKKGLDDERHQDDPHCEGKRRQREQDGANQGTLTHFASAAVRPAARRGRC